MKSENKGSAKVMAWGGGPVMTSVQIGGRGWRLIKIWGPPLIRTRCPHDNTLLLLLLIWDPPTPPNPIYHTCDFPP